MKSREILKFALIGSVFAVFASACSSEPKEVKNTSHGLPPPVSDTSIEAKQVAAEQEAPYVVEIAFPKAGVNLNAKARKQLADLFKKAKGDRKIDEIKVITWADEEYPDAEKKELSSGQRELAEDRSKEIKRYLHERDSSYNISAYNMAERPNQFENFLKTTDVRIKESLEETGISTTADRKKGSAKASKAIVMLILKESVDR